MNCDDQEFIRLRKELDDARKSRDGSKMQIIFYNNQLEKYNEAVLILEKRLKELLRL